MSMSGRRDRRQTPTTGPRGVGARPPTKEVGAHAVSRLPHTNTSIFVKVVVAAEQEVEGVEVREAGLRLGPRQVTL